MLDKAIATLAWFAGEYVKDYRESSSRIYELSIKTISQINQIILTVSVASLAAIAALNQVLFASYGALAFTVILLFMLTILVSVINLYLSTLALADLRRKLNQNLASFTRLNNNMEEFKFRAVHKVLSTTVLAIFCLGLIMFMILLGVYILGVQQ